MQSVCHLESQLADGHFRPITLQSHKAETGLLILHVIVFQM